MVRKKIKKFKTAGELVLTFFFLLMAFLAIDGSEWRTDIQLSFLVNPEYSGNIKLFINGNKNPLPLRDSQLKGLRKVSFLIPHREIETIRLSCSSSPEESIFRRVILKSILSRNQWQGRVLVKLLGLNQTSDDSAFSVQLGEGIVRSLNKLSADKTIYFILAALLAPLVFYFIHYFDPRGVLLLFQIRVFQNMVFVFLGFLFFFFMDQLFFFSERSPLEEKRKMTEVPVFRFDHLSQFTRQFENFFSDSFPYRREFVYLNNLATLKCFGTSPTPKVLVGKGDWLFMAEFGKKYNNSDYYRNLRLFTVEELERWRNVLEQRQRWLFTRDIMYIFVIVPNKSTIYPEFMPQYLSILHRQSLLDQLKEYLIKYSTVTILDFREPLFRAKKNRIVYSRSDTHWNDYGAYIAYLEMMHHIKGRHSELETIPLSRFQVKRVNRSGGDLAILLNLHKRILREDFIQLQPHPPFKFSGGKLSNISKFIRQGFTNNKGATPLSVLMVHDSFYKKLKPYLSEQFSRVRYIWDWDMNFYPEIIEDIKPALVIDQMTERFLMQKSPANPELLTTNQ